jgi:hypothetical protein
VLLLSFLSLGIFNVLNREEKELRAMCSLKVYTIKHMFIENYSLLKL